MASKRLVGDFSLHGEKAGKHGMSSFQAISTAIAAQVGTGNLVGASTALIMGGPGAIFWMWVCGILGMMVKFAEATLAVHFRVRNPKGEWIGGPMYMIRDGLPKRFRLF